MERRQGIVIRTTDYREKDRLLVLFTPAGIVTVTARGVRRADSKLKNCTSIMTLGEFTYGGRLNMVLTGCEVADNFFSVWTDLKKSSAILMCFELIEKCFSREDETVDEFVFLLKCINEIAYGRFVPLVSALKFAVFCAERVGVDYSMIKEYDAKSYEILSALSVADIGECGTLLFSESEVEKAFIMLHNSFQEYVGIRLKTLKALLKHFDCA